jgi:hypothetical protein
MKKYFYQDDTLTYTKEELFNIGLELVKDFCHLNNIPEPNSIKLSKAKCSWRGVYYYDSKSIVLYENSIKQPTKIPGYKWSFPGYKADITPIGVISHELGHHIENILKIKCNILRKFAIDKKRISSYEPSAEEAFAETMRLFITNPTFLKILSPERYNILINDLKLKPIITDNWDEVLKYAHKKHIIAIENRINKSKK